MSLNVACYHFNSEHLCWKCVVFNVLKNNIKGLPSSRLCPLPLGGLLPAQVGLVLCHKVKEMETIG